MKRNYIVVALAALILSSGCLTADLMAQQQGYRPGQPVMANPSQAGQMVGLIDMARIMKEHPQIKQVQDTSKSNVASLKKYVNEQQETLRSLYERLSEFNPGTQEYKSLEGQITKRKAEVQAQLELSQKDLAQRKARDYHTVYTGIVAEVEAVAKARGLLMVIQYNGTKINQEIPDHVMMEMTKQVVWFNRNLDITDEVLARIGQQLGNRNMQQMSR